MKLLIIGGGSFGLALSSSLSRNTSNTLRLLVRNENTCIHINTHHRHPTKLIDYPINTDATTGWDCVNESDIIFLCVPSLAVMEVIKTIYHHSKYFNGIIVSCAKGILDVNVYPTPFFSNMIRGIYPDIKYGILSGPNFADEIAYGVRTITTISCQHEHYTEIENLFKYTNIETLYSPDINGIELLGSFKNVLAVAIGTMRGIYLDTIDCTRYNTIYMVVTKMVLEFSNLLSYYNISPGIVLTPAGIGDIMLTCCSNKSRNVDFGMKVGAHIAKILNSDSGNKLKFQDQENSNLVEGYQSLVSFYHLSKVSKIEMKYLELIHGLLVRHEYKNILLDYIIGS